WEYETGGPIHSAPAFAWGKVLISSTDGHLYCFAIDPEAYKEKAQKYVEENDFGRAEEVLIRAEEYATTDKDLIEIGALRNLVKLQKKEYEKKRDKLAEAEALLDEADRILWEKSYKEAYNLYAKAEKIFVELDEEFGVSFCESRISYLQGKIPEDTEAIGNNSLVLVIIILTILFSTIIFLIKRRRSTT
ncbi:MAG: PQQ-binding-like beta-propeller repeat protein, partial [Theionarchaea archaeon]|nr:PQQ-binding-like beta-propeller repeat protein [Theionarchaea archaeon]